MLRIQIKTANDEYFHLTKNWKKVYLPPNQATTLSFIDLDQGGEMFIEPILTTFEAA
jgi:hypothetical protein